MEESARVLQISASWPQRAFRFLWGAIATFLAVLYTVLLAPFTALVASVNHGHAVTHITRFWGWLILRTCGVKVEIIGLENLEGITRYVLVANHQSLLDIMAVAVYMPGEMRFVAKKELLKIPLIGSILRHSGHIVIDRQRGGQAIRRSLETVRHGYNVCVFAEGHRFSDNRVHEFSDGAAWLAIAAKLPCVPMAISGSVALFRRGAMLVVPGGRMRMAIGKPIETRNLKGEDRIELTRRLESEVRANFSSQV